LKEQDTNKAGENAKPQINSLKVSSPQVSSHEEPAQKLQQVLTMRKQRLKHKSGEFIPCLYMPHLNGSSKIMIYFHGNAEDIGLATDLLSYIMDKMSVSFLSSSFSRFIFSPWSTQATGCTKETQPRSRLRLMLKTCMTT
jgi:hypothetical protein